MLTLVMFLLTAFLTAVNVAVYAADPNPWSAAAVVFIGFVTVYNLVKAADQ